MKYILMILMILTLFLAGCGNDEIIGENLTEEENITKAFQKIYSFIDKKIKEVSQ